MQSALRSIREKIKQFFQTEEKPRPKSNMSQIISAAMATVALGGIWYQVTLNRMNALQASARQVYMAYTQASLQYPQFAYPDLKKLKEDKDPTELNRYKIYVGMMITAYDEIVALNLGPEWMAAFRFDLPDHMEYLCDLNNPLYWDTFQERTSKLIAQEKKKYCRAGVKKTDD